VKIGHHPWLRPARLSRAWGSSKPFPMAVTLPERTRKVNFIMPGNHGENRPSLRQKRTIFIRRAPPLLFDRTAPRPAVAVGRADGGHHCLLNSRAAVVPGPARACRSHFASGRTCRILWVKGVARNAQCKPVAHNTPSFFPGGAADRTISWGGRCLPLFLRRDRPRENMNCPSGHASCCHVNAASLIAW
jgi:hypothetical protein